MKISRRNVLLGATAAAALGPIASRADTPEVAIGVIYPLSGSSAQIGVDAQKAFETAADIINKDYDFKLPLAKGEGLPGLGGAKVKLVFADHQADPRGRSHRQPDLRALPDPVPVRRQLLAEPASPRPEILFSRLAP
jgi:branched-chain amino acid transport system substrate-binding protein